MHYCDGAVADAADVAGVAGVAGRGADVMEGPGSQFDRVGSLAGSVEIPADWVEIRVADEVEN